MTQRSATIETQSTTDVSWSTLDGVVVKITQTVPLPLVSAQMNLSVDQACQLTSVLLAACRTARSEFKKHEPDSSDELLTLAERLRSDQKNLTPTDLHVAAGYLELLLKFGAGTALGSREE